MRLPFPYREEHAIVRRNVQTVAALLDWPRVIETARPWVDAVRADPPPFWAMESLLKEYPISKPEGLALMRLAEALLRVPDSATAIALTSDQLGRAQFDGSAEGAQSSALARLSNSVIALSKKTLPEVDQRGGVFSRLGAKTVVAATLRAVQLLARQFVLGQTIEGALAEAKSLRRDEPRLRFSFDMLGEGARTMADAERYFESYRHAIAQLAHHHSAASGVGPADTDGISIKLSALHPRYEEAQHERVLAELEPRVWQLCEMAANARINLTIDAEEVDRLELSLDVFEALLRRVRASYPAWEGFGLALQAYQTRSLELIEHVGDLARRHGVRLMCRLVKGAYWDSEVKRAQELGLPAYPVFTQKPHSDSSYLACAASLLRQKDVFFPQFATHNAGTIAAIVQLAERHQAPFELQRLHGMGGGVYREVLRSSVVIPTQAVRVYAPVGSHEDLLAYLVRRLLENGANSSFVHQLADDAVAVESLLASPLEVITARPFPLPCDILAPRRNSDGVDLTVETMRAPLFAALARTVVTKPTEATPEQARQAVVVALDAFVAWRDRSPGERAALLRAAADRLQQELPRFAALLVAEAHKSWGDAVAEVREAIDFLRYYADDGERVCTPVTLPGPTGESNVLHPRGRGVWVCISPWNFPLAIFLGQVAAALVTGNVVVAKPAEQTPAIAEAAVALLHEAGVPSSVVQVVCGLGETVGAALVADPAVAGVVFTGSTQVAKLIQRALAAKDGPIVPLIAETGGINAMVVDSTALPEHVVDAVVQSAFRSAGQRCSALRLLCVHAEIADRVLAMLRGAMAELVVGDPALLATDIGPLIDREAFDTVARQVAALHVAPLAERDAELHRMRPQCVEVAAIGDVKHEIFGPVLQVVRWQGDPGAVIDAINALGYGLTLGIQTRIDSRAAALAQRAHVGNVYVNRNIIGAVVGVQPFGGEGLSGTGPKAGGPFYLSRFLGEQTITVNTVAAGGNVTLLTS
ncbi:MAG: bifunctional proline dehydrogenase/L-glutamate gamma-semialdehyde dehydrogenase PutA [Proteobacteria bacterium]|nr:bifunctional proline dehydrogenase/L-glutamate gamma-semialdehyde dehydrogenase PutA [Pseudomonadota bacterium]